MRLRLTSTTTGLALGNTAAVAAALGGGTYLFSIHHFETLLESARGTALAQGELIREALEHQMVENDRSLIAQMVESFGRQPQVAAVMLLDRDGRARYAGGPAAADVDLRIGSPTCQACHRYPPEQRTSSRVIEASGGTVLRTVVPFRNREACHRCHDASHEINGILLLDVDVGALRHTMNRDLRWMLGGTGALAMMLVAVIAMVFRLAVLRRLQRFETTARLIAQGDLARRVPAQGSDTVSWLARAFNTMADSMSGLVNEVESQRGRLETIINSIDDGIVVLDAKRNVIAANAAFLKRTGRSREQALGCCCRDLAPGLCSIEDCPTMACLGSGERQVRICERPNDDASASWEEIHASPIRGTDGELIYVVEVWRDISERRAAEARLAESHRLASLGVLASGFSHELNTPLATVLTCVEGILRDAEAHGAEGDRERVVEHATIAREQVLRCRGITQHFLRLSRGQASSGVVVDIHAAIAAATRLVEPTARAASVKIEVEPVDPGLRVRADEAELQHALINLLLNAVQACGAGGRVLIDVAPGETLRIRVRDDGCGIAPEHQKRIFEPFFSLRKGGTGLGLFLSLNFVRRWGGDILVGSTPGKGSIFEVALPALRGEDQRASSS
jgi:PAS domain S-box-containing protein